MCRFVHLRAGLFFALSVFAILGVAICNPQTARAVTPESPEVKAVLKKAFKFLEDAKEDRLGGKCLIAMAFLKDGADPTHPKIIEAVEACQAAAKAEANAIPADIYSTGIAIIFLCELDPSKYNGEIRKFLTSLELRQKKVGGWGYPDGAHADTGDTSMTQYGALSTWEVSKAGFKTSLESAEKCADWLIRTQDPRGNWGYQGKPAEDDPPKLIKQDSAALGLTCAGLGSCYICADLLKIMDLTSQEDPNLPPALKLVKKGVKQEALTKKVDPKLMRAALSRGTSWFRQNYKIDPAGFTHYYLYALERFQSFREAATGKTIKEPKWYNDGFVYLRKTQNKDNGSWKSAGGEAVDTAFAALFLLRSTKKSIERAKALGEGALLVGRGLPADLNNVKLREGQIVANLPGTASELVDVLHQPDNPAYGELTTDVDSLVKQLATLSGDERTAQLVRIRELVSIGQPEARMAAVKTLGRIRDLESTPTLIFALGDPDWRVASQADEALQYASQTVAGTSLGDKPNEDVRRKAIARWKAWYLAIRPDAEFES